MELSNYQIIQRNKDGNASINLSARYPDNMPKNANVFIRVMREDDNLMIVGWTRCEIGADFWSCHIVIPQGGLYRLEGVLSQKENEDLEWCRRFYIVKMAVPPKLKYRLNETSTRITAGFIY